MFKSKLFLVLTLVFTLIIPSIATIPVAADIQKPVVHLTFDGDSSDSSGNSHDGVIFGSTSYVSGPVGQALNIENGYVTLSKTSSLTFKKNAATISFWLKNSRLEKNTPRILFRVPNNNKTDDNFHITNNPGNAVGISFKGNYGTSGEEIYKGPLATVNWDTWNMVTLVCSYDHIYMYIDGKQTFDFPINPKDTFRNGSDLLPTGQDMEIGTSADNMKLSNVSIDDFRFYDVSLSADDVKSLYTESTKAAYTGASQWATPELNKAASAGLIPEALSSVPMNQPIDREEFCEVSVKLYEKVTGVQIPVPASNPFSDTSNSEILKAYSVGITSGTTPSTFSPTAHISREQCAAMLYRAMKAMNPSGDFSTAGLSDFPDQASISSYAADAAKYMAKLGIIKGDSKGNFMPKATTSAQEAAGYGMATREAAVIMSERIYNTQKH